MSSVVGGPVARSKPTRRGALTVLALAAASIAVTACATQEKVAVVDAGGAPETSPALEGSSEHVLKRRVAIARFSNETLYGKSVLLLREANLIARQASDILASRLAESGKFVVIEFSDKARLQEALDYKEVKELGVPADLLIVGSVTEFGRETSGKTGVFSRTKVQKAHARVNVRLVDVEKGTVIFATEGAGSAESEVGTVMGVGTKEGYDSTLNDKAISAAIAKVVGNLMEQLLEQPWRSYVLSADGGAVIIAGGKSQGIKSGDRFVVMQRGKVVPNPQSGGTIELPRKQVAVIEVNSVFGSTRDDEGSRCAIVEGAIPTPELGEYIVVEMKP